MRLPAPDGDALRRWYTEELQPRLSRMHPTEVAVGAAMVRSCAYYVSPARAFRTLGTIQVSPSSSALSCPGRLWQRCLVAKDLRTVY